MKKIAAFLLLCVLILPLTSCKKLIRGQLEVDQAQFIEIAGVDVSPADKNRCLLTIACPNISASGHSNDNGLAPPTTSLDLMTMEGRTLFEANRKFYSSTNQDIFWGHNQFLLIGEDMAKRDISAIMDFFMRDHENKMSIKVLIVRGGTAKDFMTKANMDDEPLPDKLDSLMDNTAALSVSREMPLYTVMGLMLHPYPALYIPTIQLVPLIGDNKCESGKMDVEMGGYALFRKNKMTTYIDDEVARGINWVNNKVISSTIIIPQAGKKDLTLEVINTSSKKTTKFVNGLPQITINIKVLSNIAEQQSDVDIYNAKGISELEDKQAQSIKSEALKAIAMAKEQGVDMLGIGEAVRHQHPVLWHGIEQKWMKVFPMVRVNVIVYSRISRVYEIEKHVSEVD